MSSPIQPVIDALNDALARDPYALKVLLAFRVRCNPALAKHPTIQVGTDGCDEFFVRPIGLINGVLASLDLPLLAIQESAPGKIFGFQEYVPPAFPPEDEEH